MKLLNVLPACLALAACQGPGADAPMSGYAEAEFVVIAPSSGGVLQALPVQRGDRVTRGQLLFALDDDAEARTRDAAQARATRSEATLADLRKGRRPNELAAIDQQLLQAQAALKASASALQRQQALVAQGYVAPLQLDDLQAARDRDQARVRELQAQRALAAEAARSDTIAAAAAEARAGGAESALAQWRLGQRQRVSPADALVYDVMARPGEWVNAGTPVLTLLPPGAVKVRFFVPEAALPQATVGREVLLGCDGCPAGLKARVRYVAPQAEFTPPVIYSVGTRAKLVFLVEATPADAAALKPGQPLDVRWASAP